MNSKSMMRCVALISVSVWLPLSALAQETELPAFAVTDIDAIRTAIGTEAKVTGVVADTGKSRSGHNFLDFAGTEFNVFVPSSAISKFPDGEPADVYRGLEVTFRGEIAEYNGKPQIVLNSPDQVTVAGGMPTPPTDPVPPPPDTNEEVEVLELIDASDQTAVVASAGKKARVRGFVSESNKTATTGANFLNLQDSDFTVVIFGKALTNFTGGEPATIYKGKWIEVSGMIELHQDDAGRPQIVVESPDQIREVAEPKEEDPPSSEPTASPGEPTPSIPEGPKEVDWRDYFEK